MSAPTPIPTPSPTHPVGSPWSLIDAATYLGVSRRHLHRLIDAGRVRVTRIGRRVLVPDSEVRKLAGNGD
ncbi:MAG: DNA-binding protein [Planctomycetaceae bacterium]|nr:DNA-binding protein [Planctomycetaceae bacterium]